MNVCPRCGKPQLREHRFCGFCGCNLMVENVGDFVTKIDLNVDDVKFDLGVLYYQEGKYEQASAIFQTILKFKPDHKAANEMFAKAQAAIE
jgi:tetratricopeptide (TPR) repeat protein